MVRIKLSTAVANVLSPVSVSEQQLRVLKAADNQMKRTVR